MDKSLRDSVCMSVFECMRVCLREADVCFCLKKIVCLFCGTEIVRENEKSVCVCVCVCVCV